MGQACSVCTHPDHAAIDRAIVAKLQSNRRIATQFQVSEAALRRHAKEHLPQVLAEATQPARVGTNRRSEPTHAHALATQVHQQEEQRRAHAVDLEDCLARAFSYMEKLGVACDAWLTDPADGDRYTLDPRAHEIQVVYTVTPPGGTPLRKRDTLGYLLRLVEGKAQRGTLRIAIDRGETKIADPRMLVVHTAKQLTDQVARMVEMKAQVWNMERMERLESAFLAALEKAAPDVQREVVDVLRRRSVVGIRAGES